MMQSGERRAPVFVINLARRPDRLAQITAELERVQVPFERVDAVDAGHLRLDTVVHRILAYVYGGFASPRPGSVACFLSHRSIWERMVAEEIPVALILEDDVLAVDWEPSFLSIDPSSYGVDMLRIGANQTRDKFTGRPLQPDGGCLAGREMTRGSSAGSCAYIISQSGARKTLALRRYVFPMDHFDMWRFACGLEARTLLPLAFVPARNADSEIASFQIFSGPRLYVKVRMKLRYYARHVVRGIFMARYRVARLVRGRLAG